MLETKIQQDSCGVAVCPMATYVHTLQEVQWAGMSDFTTLAFELCHWYKYINIYYIYDEHMERWEDPP